MMKPSPALICLVFASCWTASMAADPPSDHRPVVAPDGASIVFMSTRAGGDWELYRIGIDGSNLRRLTHHEGWDGYAAFVPTGETFTFDRGTGDRKAPYRYSPAAGSAEPFVADPEGWVSINDWHPSGDKAVAFIERDQQRDLYYVSVTGEILGRITATEQQSEHDAHFAPDGQWLAFAVNLDEGSALDVMDLQTGAIRRLVESPEYLYGLSWSPNGRTIAYTDTPAEHDDQGAELYLLDTVTGEVERLTHNTHYDHMPVWMPGGTALLFTSYATGREEMYLLDLESGAVTPFATGLDPLDSESEEVN